MKRILVLGAGGMLGHTLIRVLARSGRVHVVGTVRTVTPSVAALGAEMRSDVRADAPETVERVIRSFQPDDIVNCIGIVKQIAELVPSEHMIRVNALFPHLLQDFASAAGARVIHISTDCVFSGRRGSYAESDLPDPIDSYGLTKLVGEVAIGDSLTLRTSVVGPQMVGYHGLLAWLLTRTGDVPGYVNAWFSGLTTTALSQVVLNLIESYPRLLGLFHVAGPRISKFDLLTLLADGFAVGVTVRPDPSVVIDRSLNGSRFAAATGFTPGPWRDMIREMREAS